MGSIPPRRRALLLGAASAAVLAAAPARAQSPYPDRPVRVIVGLQAGASTDTLGRAPSYLAVRASLPVRDAREFVAYAKANDGKIAFGQGGNGSNPHLAALTLLRSLGVRGVEVAYKGNAPAAVALAAGEIDFAMLDLAAVRPMVEGGKVRLLAVTEPKRAGLTPDVPTSGEQGLTRELDGVTPWFMLVAPAGTPAAIVALLNRHVDQVMREPEVRQSLVAAGIEPESGTPGEAQAYFLKQREHVARLVGDLRVSLRQ